MSSLKTLLLCTEWIQAMISIAPCLLVAEVASPICGITSEMTN